MKRGSNISTIHFKSGDNLKGVITSYGDPIAVNMIVNEKQYPVLIKRLDVLKIVKSD